MPKRSASFKAISSVRSLFEHIHGNLGILKFNVEELTPTNGNNGEESKNWDVVCSFYETLGSTEPSRYKTSVNIETKSVIIKKLSGPSNTRKIEGRWSQSTPKKTTDQ